MKNENTLCLAKESPLELGRRYDLCKNVFVLEANPFLGIHGALSISRLSLRKIARS